MVALQPDAGAAADTRQAEDAAGDPPLPAAAPPPPPAVPPAAPAVVLRVEVATKGQARLVTWSVIMVNIMCIGVVFVLLGLYSKENVTAGDLRPSYRVFLVMGCICLGLLLLTAAQFAYGVRQSQREGRVWSARQTYFARTAGLLLGLQIAYSTAFVAAYASVVASQNCDYPWSALSGLTFLQWTFFSLIMFLFLARLQNMTVWRGEGALAMDPDRMLLVDRPPGDKLRSQMKILLIWTVLEAFALVAMANRLVRSSKGVQKRVLASGCDTDLGMIPCGAATVDIISSVVTFFMVLLILILWVSMVRRVQADHRELPYHRYRATHIFIRVQTRVLGPALAVVLLSVLLLNVVPSFRRNCWSGANASLGNMPLELCQTVAALVMAALYMPKGANLDSPVLQEFLQDFSWTQAALPADLQLRNQRLSDSETPSAKPEAPRGPGLRRAGARLERMVSFLPGKLTGGLAWLAGVPDAADAAARLRKEPMFCMETAVRLFYWARLAYQETAAPPAPASSAAGEEKGQEGEEEAQGDAALEAERQAEREAEQQSGSRFVNAGIAMQMFDLEQHETIWDELTDTHCVIGWSSSRLVLAFRGTASLQNVMTDMKAWRVAVQPSRRRRGRLVTAHAGFLKAWLHRDFDDKVMSKVAQIAAAAQAAGMPLRIWVTGHSLGGALAVLASLEVARRHPDSQLTCYTLGCPRVGNSAFADEFNELVPDTWAIINGQDPVPWIPKGGFKRAGQRVTIDGRGSLILRPTYFELSVVHRGSEVKDHMTGSYAQSLAAILRAQFVASKALAGGPQGVEQLAAAVDLGACLVLTHMGLDSLRDPAQLPEAAEVAAARAAEKLGKRASGSDAGGTAMGCCGGPIVGGALSMRLRRGSQQRAGEVGSGKDGDASGLDEQEQAEAAAAVPQQWDTAAPPAAATAAPAAAPGG